MHHGLQICASNGLPGTLFENVCKRRPKTRVPRLPVKRRHKPCYIYIYIYIYIYSRLRRFEEVDSVRGKGFVRRLTGLEVRVSNERLSITLSTDSRRCQKRPNT